MVAIAAIVGLFGLFIGWDGHTIYQRHNMTVEVNQEKDQDLLKQWKAEKDAGQLSPQDYDMLIRGWESNR